MTLNPVKLLAVVFGNFKDIGPDPVTIQRLFNHLKEWNFVPGAAAELEIIANAINQQPRLIQLLRFSTIDQSASLTFKKDRIDLELNHILTGTNFAVEERLDFANCVFKAIFTEFGRNTHRLSCVTYYTNDNLTNTNKDDLYIRLFGKFGSQDQDLAEWSHRIVKRNQRAFNKKVEVFNNIVNIKRGFSNILPGQTPLNRIELTIDINTVPEKREMRFDVEDCETFLTSSTNWHKTELDKLTNFLK